MSNNPRPIIHKLEPGEKLGKPTKCEKGWLDGITSIKCGDDMQFNLKYYKLEVDHEGWAYLTRKKKKRKS